LPPNIRISATDRSLVFDSNGTIVSTALLCPGYTFDAFGSGGPRLSPDQHWVLVDVRGPYEPGNVARAYVLAYVRSGVVVFGNEFPTAVGAPSPADRIDWSSGERATLRYKDGRTYRLVDPPREVKREACSAILRLEAN
jgi:hypothetical protein